MKIIREKSLLTNRENIIPNSSKNIFKITQKKSLNKKQSVDALKPFFKKEINSPRK